MFRVIIRGRNCEKYIVECLQSLLNQSCQHWHAHLILDHPKDNSSIVSGEFIWRCAGKRVGRLINQKHMGVCYNIYNIPDFVFFDDEDIMVFLDADDWLKPGALEIVKNTYKKHDCLATCGSFISAKTKKRHHWNRFYPKGANHRKLPFSASHLKTVKVKVFKTLPEEYFTHKGKWGEAASDVALMLPIIDRIGLKNIRHIKEGIYAYRENAKSNLSRELQKKWKKIWQKKKPLKKLF
jgi:glycosyltransferase involved in cell wall biosynthesis